MGAGAAALRGCEALTSNYARGAKRERDVRDLLEQRGWLVVRGAGSKGMDLVALKDGKRPMCVEVKATKTAYSGFPPADRAALLAAAEKAGAEALLVWWPYDRRGPRWIGSPYWPTRR